MTALTRCGSATLIALSLSLQLAVALADAADKDPLAVLDADGPPDASAAAPSARDSGPAEDAIRSEEIARWASGESISPLSLARKLYAEGKLTNAEIAVKQLLRDDAFDQDALLLMAELQLARFQSVAAETTLRRALDARTPRARVLVPLAKAMNLQGKQRALLDEFALTDDLDAATRARLLAEQARARLALGQAAEAAAVLDEAAAAAPDRPEPDVGRATLALLAGNLELARENLDRALRKDANYYDAWLLLGDVERQQGRLAAAETAYGEAIARSPNHWLAAYWRAVTRLDRGDLDAAEADIALAEAQFPDFVGLAYARGRANLLRQRPNEAAVALDRYLGVVPNDANALFYAVIAANQLGNGEQALAYLERLQVVEGASTRLLWLKAKTYLAAGDASAADALLRDAVAGTAPPAELVLVAKDALVRLGRADAALDLVQKALAAQPENRDLMAAEALLRFASGDQDGAEAAALALAARDAEDIDALVIQAQAAVLRGADDPLMPLRLRRARERAPTDVRIPTLLGEWQAATGDLPAACASLVDALRLDPNQTGIIARLQRLGCASIAPDLIQDVSRELLASDADLSGALPALLAMNPGEIDTEAGVARLREAVAVAPDNDELRASYVMALLRLDRQLEARAALDAVPTDQYRAAPILRVRGLAALIADDPETAVDAFEDLRQVAPDSIEAVYLLAEAQARGGDLPAARATLTEGLRRDAEHPLVASVVSRLFAADDSPAARRRLIDDLRRFASDSSLIEPLQVQTLLDAGRPEEAAQLLADMQARKPDDAALLLKLLATLDAAGQRARAIALAEPWLQAHPDAVRVGLAVGDLHARAGETELAALRYRQVLRSDPENLLALNNLAVVLTDTDAAAAVTLAERVYAKAPREPQVLDTYGAALLAVGDAKRASELLDEAFSLSQGAEPSIGLNLARALAANGEPKRAREVLQLLLQQRFPQRDEVEALLLKLGTLDAD